MRRSAALRRNLRAAIEAEIADLLEYAFRASPTLGRAFEQLVRYRRVVREDLEVALIEDGARVSVAFTLGQPGPVLRQQANYFLFGWLRIARDATGRGDIVPLETRVPYPAPERVFGIERAFGGCTCAPASASTAAWPRARARFSPLTRWPSRRPRAA